MKTRLFAACLLAVSLILGLTWALTWTAAGQEASPGSTIVVAMIQEPNTLYIYGTALLAASHVQQAFLDGPFDNRSYDSQPVILEKLPGLADGDAITRTVTVHAGERYVSAGSIVTATEEISATQMVVTFTLKPDILWSDGHPLSAADSAFSFQVACHPDTPRSKHLCERTASYEAVEDQVAVWTGLPGYLAAGYFTNFWTPLPEHVLGSMTPAEILNSDYGRHPLGWGAFVVDEWVAGQHIRLSRNPRYWREGLPKADRLVFRFFPDAEQALQALLRGEVHVVTQDATSLPGQTYLDLEAQGLLDAHFVSGTVWEHIDFDIQPADERVPFFADGTVRQVVAYGTNRQKMVDDILFGQVQVLHTFIPPEHPFYPPPGVLTEYPYDPATARTMLESEGWRDDDGDGIVEAHDVVYQVPTWDWEAGTYGPTQTITIPDATPFVVTFKTTSGNPMRQQTAEQFRQDMAAIGISVTLEFLPAGALWPKVFGRQFDLAQFAWLTGVEPPCDLYLASDIPAPENGWAGQNETGFVDADYDAACNAALATLDRNIRASYFNTAQRIFSEKLPVLPLFTLIKVALTSPDLIGFQMDPTEDSELWNVEEWKLRHWVYLPLVLRQ